MVKYLDNRTGSCFGWKALSLCVTSFEHCVASLLDQGRWYRVRLMFVVHLSFNASPPNLFIYLFIYLFMAVLGLRLCARAFSSCGKWGPLLIAVRGPLTVAASPVVEHRLQTRRLSSCGSGAQSLRGMWDPPRSGLEPVSPALAGRISTTAPPGKPSLDFLRVYPEHCLGSYCFNPVLIRR